MSPEPGTQTSPEQPADPEDVKIITLARAARARAGSAQGACVRDVDGRTYSATDVDLAHLRLPALSVAVAMAVSSGAPGLEAAALSSATPPSATDLAVVGDLPGRGVRVWYTDAAGAVLAVVDLDG